MSCNDYSFRAKIFVKLYSLFMRTYKFEVCDMTAQTSCIYGCTKVIKFIAYIKKLFCKNCLYADYS